jgi:L-amino acid N-acyltransferase YncA
VTYKTTGNPDAALTIRDAVPADVDAILAIYNDAILNGIALWRDDPVDRADRAAWFAGQTTGGFPVLIAELDGAVVGYASYGLWRPFAGFRHTVTDTIYLVEGVHGRGIGSTLLAMITDHARGAGYHVLIADIESGNAASIRLHQHFGFEVAGEIREVGTKFGTWLDLTIMRLQLQQNELQQNERQETELQQNEQH